MNTPVPVPGAAVSGLLANLQHYEQCLDALVEQRWDADLYMAASALFERMRGDAAQVAGAQLFWVQMIITRFELSEALWHARGGAVPQAQVLALHARHKAAIADLAGHCAQRIARLPPA